ncbi:MAG TPA: hypothetical protein VNU46_00115 [Gemmatimonadaceae bacterium]|jgi:hypothetical protein|nr:hypothetical protein [Gemmatimonadaceae bacterium]
MNTVTRKSSDRLQSILYFCQNLPTPLTAPALGTNFAPQVQALQDAVTQLISYTSTTASGAIDGSIATRNALRRTLRVDHLDPIRRVSRALKLTHPEIPSLVRLPAFDAGIDAQLSAARAIARDITPYHDLFVADGLPADFIDQLNAAIQALAQSADARRAEQQQRAATQEGIKTALANGRQAARHLDPLVRSAIKNANDPVNDPLALAAWERAYRAVRVTVPPVAATPASATSAAPAAVAKTTSPAAVVATPAVVPGTPAVPSSSAVAG